MSVKINRIIGPQSCPKCGASGDDLVIAARQISTTTLNGRFTKERSECIGYDCRSCGVELRFGNPRKEPPHD